jgi:hypothetical protein
MWLPVVNWFENNTVYNFNNVIILLDHEEINANTMRVTLQNVTVSWVVGRVKSWFEYHHKNLLCQRVWSRWEPLSLTA